MKRIISLCIAFFAMLLSHHAFAQDREVTGKITSSDGAALPGVGIVVKGTTIAATTDAEGKFKISVPPDGKTLIFSFIGFAKQEIEIGDKTTIDVKMSEDKKLLEEVVVVGYGVQPKKEVTGAISTVKGDVIKDAPVQSFEQVLAGQATGVNIVVPNGVLNNPPVIRVRGFNSITSNSYPLVVVDGMPIFTGNQSGNSAANNPLGDINPADIESIEILKDASATAIYGSRAANGVMIVTTRKGDRSKPGKANVNYSSWTGISKVTGLPDLLNAEEYILIKNEGRKNANLTDAFFPDYDANGNLIDTKWSDYVYRTSISHNHHLSISGASESTSYYFSGGYSHQDGFIVNNEFERKSVRFNIDQKVAKIIKLGANVNFTNGFNSAPNTGSIPGQGFNTSGLARLAFVTAPNVSPYNSDGGYNITSTNAIGQNKNTTQSGFYNPLPILDLNTFTSESNHLMATFSGEVEIIKGLTGRTAYSIDNNSIEDILFQSPVHGDGFTNKGVSNNTTTKLERWAWTNSLHYQKSIAEKHNITLLAGGEEQYSIGDGWGGSRQGVSDDFFDTYQGNFLTNNPPVGNFQTENGFLSYFGRATYDFKKKYFVTASFRRDGFSGLSEANKFGNFGGASAGWTLSDENFYKNFSLSKTVNSIRLRASYGKVGNMGIPDFGSLSLYNSGLYADASTITYSQTGNSELKWETSTKTDVGFTMGILKDRVQVELSYFNNDVNELILASPQAPSKGIPNNSILLNVGSMYNKGVEVGVVSTNIDKEKFKWTSNFNYTALKNEVTALTADGADIVGTTSALERTNITRVGYAVGSIYAVRTEGVNPENGQRIFLDSSDVKVQYNHVPPTGQSRWTYVEDYTDALGVFHAKGSAAPAINPARDAKVIGSAIPKYYGGFNNTFKYKDIIDLNINIIFSGGNYIYNGSKAGMHDQRFWNNTSDVLDRWTTAGQETDIPRVVYGDNVSNGSSFPISENVEKGDYIKLKTVALGYTFREKVFGKTGITSLRIYVQVQNLYTITKYTGFDPEVSSNGNSNLTPGIDRNTVPQSKIYTFGLNLAF